MTGAGAPAGGPAGARSGPSPAITSRPAGPPRAGWLAWSATAAASSPPTAARSAPAGSRLARRAGHGIAPCWRRAERVQVHPEGTRTRLPAPIRPNSAAAHPVVQITRSYAGRCAG